MSCSSAARSFLLAPFYFFPSARPGPGQPHLFAGVYTGGREHLPAGQESSHFALEHASVVSQSGLLISERAEGRRPAASSFRAPLFFRNNEPDISPSFYCSPAASHACLRASSHLFFLSSLPGLAFEMATSAILEVALARSSLRPRRRSSKSTTWTKCTNPPTFFFLGKEKRKEEGGCAS